MASPSNKLQRVLNPRTVAVVGDKRANGYLWLRNMSTFQGKLYSVQIDPNEIPGIEEIGVPNFPSLADIPDDIDYVLCAVPRPIAPRIIADCAAQGVGGVALFTSGFAETGEEEGARLQADMGRIARDLIRLFDPERDKGRMDKIESVIKWIDNASPRARKRLADALMVVATRATDLAQRVGSQAEGSVASARLE